MSKRLRVSIGSGDPITFATNLPNEYVHIHDSLMLAAVGSDRADRWLERARQTGLHSRFTIQIVDDLDLSTTWMIPGIEAKVPEILYG